VVVVLVSVAAAARNSNAALPSSLSCDSDPTLEACLLLAAGSLSEVTMRRNERSLPLLVLALLPCGGGCVAPPGSEGSDELSTAGLGEGPGEVAWVIDKGPIDANNEDESEIARRTEALDPLSASIHRWSYEVTPGSDPDVTFWMESHTYQTLLRVSGPSGQKWVQSGAQEVPCTWGDGVATCWWSTLAIAFDELGTYTLLATSQENESRRMNGEPPVTEGQYHVGISFEQSGD
jgi:hypothetical protein